MTDVIQLREKYYKLGRIFAVFIVSPFLIYKGKKYNDNYLVILGILLFLWDGMKLMCKNN